jgi:hypothetical protein
MRGIQCNGTTGPVESPASLGWGEGSWTAGRVAGKGKGKGEGEAPSPCRRLRRQGAASAGQRRQWTHGHYVASFASCLRQ